MHQAVLVATAWAAKMWRQIRYLPFAQQRRVVRWHSYTTTAVFDLLRDKSRQEGRKDRQLGVRLARLTLDSLVRPERFQARRSPSGDAGPLSDRSTR